ncbi:cytidine/deoxycytidylate deaminase family protein [bacterium]|nr:cytidine/deoxycytidylate deaminase family protein [bacterium]
MAEETNKDTRPGWDEYFMEMAHLVASRSTCLRRKVGAILVRDKRILATGYNGAPKDSPHCIEIGCLREKMKIQSGEHHELCRGIHAEQNALIQAAIFGTSVEGSDLYCTNQPCTICLKMLINAKIKTLYIAGKYPDELSDRLIKEAKLNVINMEGSWNSRIQRA